ncbi:MAG: riboflavin synthase [Candidatus Acetothermia bacterium]|jgi:riboflavin synthase|nr:riboflavin synthase [Candidatus Acetothermia bacterium]MDH7505281.1 riboflavin synthase [Candidatus Acetothermia bacterium]
MFTGIVAGLGEVVTLAGGRLVILPPAELLPPAGGSIAVNGACLTASEVEDGRFAADLSPETLKRTNLGALRAGEKVNLELPLAAGDRFAGHLVLGHIDAVGKIVAIAPQGESYLFSFAVEPRFDHLLVEKGSVAVDGISLTAFNIREGRFEVAIIPHTYRMTNLKYRRPGDLVNVEFDILGKYVAKLMNMKVKEVSWSSIR